MTESSRTEALALIEKAWRKRFEALRSPSPDAETQKAIAARVEADLVRACGLLRKTGARTELSIALGKLGHVALDSARTDRALALFEEAVTVSREVEDPLRLAHAVRHLGQVHHGVGGFDQAARCYDEALALYERDAAAHPLDHANAIRPMALLQEELGDLRRAGALWRQAAELYRAAGVDAGVEECEAHLLAGLPRPVAKPPAACEQ